MSENSLSTSASGVAVLTKLNVHATKSSVGEQNISDDNEMALPDRNFKENISSSINTSNLADNLERRHPICHEGATSDAIQTESPSIKIKSVPFLGVGTFSLDLDSTSRGITTGRFNKRNKTRRCGDCPGCTASNCNKCVNCLDMVRNGGPGNLKQACIDRRCIKPQIPGHEPSLNCTKIQNNMPPISTILPTTSSEMIEMEEIATKYILASVQQDSKNISENNAQEESKESRSFDEDVPRFQQMQKCIPNVGSADICYETDDTNRIKNETSNKGFIKMLQKAERYVNEFDVAEQSRPKLSYGAMCALAIKVHRSSML